MADASHQVMPRFSGDDEIWALFSFVRTSRLSCLSDGCRQRHHLRKHMRVVTELNDWAL